MLMIIWFNMCRDFWKKNSVFSRLTDKLNLDTTYYTKSFTNFHKCRKKYNELSFDWKDVSTKA